MLRAGHRQFIFQQHAQRYEVHVGDAVLETGGNESGDWKDDSEDFIDDATAGEGEPNGHADQDIAQNAREEGVPKRQRCFGGGYSYRVNSNRGAVHLPVIRQKDQHDQTEGTGEIGELDDDPVAQ